jgi:hypothetical protein
MATAENVLAWHHPLVTITQLPGPETHMLTVAAP